jgi:uncharacterized protein (DUF1800 family)
MDRRATIATLMGKASAKKTTAPPVVNTGLDLYTGPWETAQALHLLRRTTFGPTKSVVQEAVDLGLEGTVSKLFEALPLPLPPVNYDYPDDPYTPIGNTWINSPHNGTNQLRGSRRRSLNAWTLDVILKEGISIREKLTLFWHNHFAVNRTGVNDPRFFYRYITTIRSQAWGNFRQLVKDITIDPCMLRFLNGRQNTAGSPNENYARELMELFTIGKGPLAGPGDYTHFTEEDVLQMARILTGWRDRGHNTQDPTIQLESYFTPSRHDAGEKQLSHRFDNSVVSDMGANEYAHLVDIIFTKDEVARFISRKLYRWFVYYDISEDVELEIIEPMAQLLIDNEYEIQPVLETLLRSNHFFDILNQGPMIRNPLDFTTSLLKVMEVPLPEENFQARYRVLWQLFRRLIEMQMEYFFLPDVAGWQAYYQAPLYYRAWINATSLQLRSDLASTLANNGYTFNGNRVRIDPLSWIQQFEDALEPNAMIQEMVQLLLPQPLTESQLAGLKEVLIPGLPDFEWTLEYGNYLGDPENEELRDAVENKLRALINTIINLAEFHLS